MTPLPYEGYGKAREKGFDVMVTEVEDGNPGTSVMVNSDWYRFHSVTNIHGEPANVFEKVSETELPVLKGPRVPLSVPKVSNLEDMVLA